MVCVFWRPFLAAKERTERKKALPGCHSFGATIDEARQNIVEAIELHIEGMRADGEAIPVEREPLLITRLSVPVAA